MKIFVIKSVLLEFPHAAKDMMIYEIREYLMREIRILLKTINAHPTALCSTSIDV